MEKIKSYFLEHKIDLGLTAFSILLTCIMHWLGFFDFLEFRMLQPLSVTQSSEASM